MFVVQTMLFYKSLLAVKLASHFSLAIHFGINFCIHLLDAKEHEGATSAAADKKIIHTANSGVAHTLCYNINKSTY
jgi:hypothetical protein